MSLGFHARFLTSNRLAVRKILGFTTQADVQEIAHSFGGNCCYRKILRNLAELILT